MGQAVLERRAHTRALAPVRRMLGRCRLDGLDLLGARLPLQAAQNDLWKGHY